MNQRHILTALLVSTGMNYWLAQPAPALAKDHKPVEASVVIKAPPEEVFEHIKLSRCQEPGRRKVVSHVNGVAVIEEQFDDLPIIGKAHCTYREVETPGTKVEYSLMSSDKLRFFEGVWVLSPLDGGQKTLVKLSSYTEAKLNVPFAREIAGNSALKDVRRRLANLKHWTEDAGCDSDHHLEHKPEHKSDHKSDHKLEHKEEEE